MSDKYHGYTAKEWYDTYILSTKYADNQQRVIDRWFDEAEKLQRENEELKKDVAHCKHIAEINARELETLHNETEELKARPDHGKLEGVQLPAWMWCREWKRKAYVLGRGVCNGQYAEMSYGTVSYLPPHSLEPYRDQDTEAGR